MAPISPAALDALSSAMRGPLVRPGDQRYDELRVVWNGTIDRRPAAIARPASTEDVVAVVKAAREAACPLAVRGGGHSMPGFSTCDEGIVLDLRDMAGVVVDPERRTVSVQGGALIGALDGATQEHGLAVPMGTVSHTGVAGLTLGGGLGRLTRMHGLALDALTGVEIVTADGTVLTASQDENDELFWGVRGAGANFGVVTRLHFRAFPIERDLHAALGAFELTHAADVLTALSDYERTAPEHMVVVAAVRTVQAGPPFPAELHGRRMLTVGVNSFASPDRAEKEAREVIQLAPPAFELSLRVPFLAAQQMNDPFYPWGKRYYVKGGLLESITPGVASAALDAMESAPGGEAEVDFIMMGGAASRVPEDATAYSGRSARFFNGIQTVWQEPSEDQTHRAWCRSAYASIRPFHLSANYVNAVEETDQASVRETYGTAKFERLVALKRRYDPANLFRLNNNIHP